MADNRSEIPQTMHELADRQLKQAHAAYDQITTHITNAMSVWMTAIPSNPITVGLKDVQNRAMEISKQNAESAFLLAGKIVNAKTLQEVLTLQTQFAQDRMQAFATQTQELCKLIGETVPKLQRGRSLH
jgi:hypothetical protein